MRRSQTTITREQTQLLIINPPTSIDQSILIPVDMSNVPFYYSQSQQQQTTTSSSQQLQDCYCSRYVQSPSILNYDGFFKGFNFS